MDQIPQFVPAQPQQPKINPTSPDSVPQGVSNIPSGTEQQSQWSKSVSRSKQLKAATGAVIQTRADLAAFLMQQRIKLLTSSVEFQQTGDFIQSSYIIYLDYNNMREPFKDFIQRYPNLIETANIINEKLRPVGQHMNVISNPQKPAGIPGFNL